MFSADPLGVEPREVPGAATRRARSEDGPAYARDIGTDTASTFRARLSDATGCYVVEMDGRLIHVSWVSTSKAWTRELRAYIRPPTGHCYIYESFTAPGARGKGIYPFALASICRDAVQRGWTRVWVAVEDNNPASLKSVRKAGFEPAFTIGVARHLGRLEVKLPEELPDPAPSIDTQRA
ncbi:MAG: GNAT family N-acetyltransferase [Actinomycetota bacterium]|nr:GNAT family N-acetyltransferase [Actinomycetota bacterium]